MTELIGKMKPEWETPDRPGYESENDRLVREIQDLETYLAFLKAKLENLGEEGV